MIKMIFLNFDTKLTGNYSYRADIMDAIPQKMDSQNINFMLNISIISKRYFDQISSAYINITSINSLAPWEFE